MNILMISNLDNDEKLEGNEKYTALKNLTSQVIYKNAYESVDIHYITEPAGVKENIILKNSSARSEFTIKYKINGLTAKSINDKLIELYDKSGNFVYSIEAPYMVDAQGISSTQLELSIVQQKNNNLTLKLTADKDFLSNCTYPVTIDPDFNTDQDWQTSECTFADSAHPNTAYGYESSTGYTGTVYVGTFGSGMYRTYLKMKSLPTLNKGDMIVGAYVNLHLYQNNFYDDMNVSAYYVKDSWSQSTLTWNNKPSYESNIIDYEIFEANESDIWHDWDVTKCVKRWYNGETNNGIMLMSPDESNELQCAAFYSSNYPSSSVPRPLFTIVYRNNKGLEDYWSYSGFSVGAALLCKNGNIYKGVNIENSSFGAGICAERSAFCTAISAGEKDFEAIAVAGGKSFGKITDYCPPCGICRQFMTEFCGGDFKIILSDGKNIKEYDLSFLAPFGFDKNRFGI